ncbi:hypothetical protein GCM10022247_42790 [Allokutzneria multivorans]|uniref:AbiTii domain-containing protein n=1 Tax=Allokutzneria multivorans TaxID=1142134 RepID=A0ABP7SRH4_9PSEU
MSTKPSGLLAKIQAGVLDEQTSLSSLLQMCIVLGGHTGSEKLRAWAREEINGYKSVDDMPEYRKVSAALYIRVVSRMNEFTQMIPPAQMPPRVRQAGYADAAPIAAGVGELEAFVQGGDAEISIIDTKNQSRLVAEFNAAADAQGALHPAQSVSVVYWSVPAIIIKGLLVRVRTTLAELVAELVSTLPVGQDLPDKASADRAIHLAIEGSGNSVTVVGHQHSEGNATVSTVAPQPAPTAGGWWKRLRKRGWVVALSTFVAAVVGVFAWLGWKPWEG